MFYRREQKRYARNLLYSVLARDEGEGDFYKPGKEIKNPHKVEFACQVCRNGSPCSPCVISGSSTANMNTRISEEQEVVPLGLITKGYSVMRQLLVYFHNITACNQWPHCFACLALRGQNECIFFLCRVHWLVPVTCLVLTNSSP